MSVKVLLVEDDPGLGFVIQDNLQHKKFDVTLCTDGDTAHEAFKKNSFDLCILDVMLPKKDGFSLAKVIREVNKDIPILFVTAKGMVEDKIIGFQSGGDDYIVKPFSMDELLCRIEVFLRRSNGHAESIFQVGHYSFDYSRLELRHESSTKTLTQKEAEVLRLLCCNRDRVLKREEILKMIWGDDDYFMGRSMDVFISKLRKYLKSDPRIQIANYHGVGFRLEVNN